jgi:transposase InsO family protein
MAALDTKIFKRILPDNASEDDYNYWKRMLNIYYTRADVAHDQQLDVLFVLCGANAFPTIEACATYNEAIALLDRKYLQQASPIMARYNLRSRTQKPGESITEFLSQLELVAKKCTIAAVTAIQHRELLLADAFVAGLLSMPIKQRLLESATISLVDLRNTATSMELATESAQLLGTTSTASPVFGATSRSATRRSTPTQDFNTSTSTHHRRTNNCVWCGGSRHKRHACPAVNSICRNCGKEGHWASVCLSKQKTTRTAASFARPTNENGEDSEEEYNAVALLAATSSKQSLISATVNGFPIQGLVDTGSDLSFIEDSFLQEHHIQFFKSDRMITLANDSVFKTVGKLNATVVVKDQNYDVELLVVSSLVAPMIVGLDVLGQHSQITLLLGGQRDPTTFCLALTTMDCPTYKLVPGGNISICKPIATSSRRSHSHETFIKAELQRMLKDGIIQESRSAWRAQCFVTNTSKKPRLVIDYSNTINIHTPVDAYPSSRVDDILNKISTNTVFSTIDLRSAYHQVPLDPEDYHLTAFEACGKLYEFKRLPFGCTNAVAIFQRIMDNFISKFKLQNTYAYIDDLVIGGGGTDAQAQHDYNLDAFMSAATKYGMQINEEKCRFSVPSISYLGNIISGGTFKPDPERFKALLDYPTPTTLRQLNGLIGLFAYYAKWIHNCSELTLPLTRSKEYIVKHKTLPIEAVAAIKELKTKLISASLAAPRLDTPLTLETDASAVALGGTLSQEGRPVAFMSRTLSTAEQNQSVVEREASAIVQCCRKWRHLLLAVPYFNVVTDQKSISFMFDRQRRSKIKHEKITRWRLELSEYNFNIQYRPGPENKVADPLSRVSSCKDTMTLTCLHERLCHPGITRLNHYVKTRNLPYSLHEIRQVITNCKACKELKPRFYNPPSSPLISSTRPWERLSMDFVGPLPSSSSTRFILVFVDEYSRYPFAFPCSKIDAGVVISHLLSLFALFGTPSSIHSDRGPQFESNELHQFLLRNGVAKTRTTPYRPQGNGQCERTNGTLLKAINLALHSCGLDKTKWAKVLDVALGSIRSLLCTATNSTPHDRFFNFPRSSITGTDLPDFLLTPGETILHRCHVRAKGDPLVEQVKLVQTISPHYAQIEYQDGRTDTVSTHHLAPFVPQTTSLPADSHVPELLHIPVRTSPSKRPPTLDPVPMVAPRPETPETVFQDQVHTEPPLQPPMQPPLQPRTSRYGRILRVPDRLQP